MAPELDVAVADRRPALLEWLDGTDTAAYLRTAGLDPGRLGRLRHLLDR